ncbi:MarR family transcriptional regulator [Neobacillus niacini]|uniref:MarR family winged helix-turn-helix transcriptional regulator n=1 Tax=Neobacillus niacini TaxID=86668 RepID=UPI0030013F34
MDLICTNTPFLLLMQTSKAIQDRIRDEMTKNNLSVTEFSALEVLYYKEKQTIQQIGSSILISSGSMTYVIDKLEKRGLIKRNDCRDDRRVIHVTLTSDGKNLMSEIMPKHQQLVDYIFNSLNKDETATITKLLEKVKNRIER